MGTLGQIKLQLIAKYGPYCQACGTGDEVLHACHVFIGTSKKYRKYTDHPANIALGCVTCHGLDNPRDPRHKQIDTYKLRQMIFFQRKGEILDWWDTLPEQMKRGRRELRELFERRQDVEQDN